MGILDKIFRRNNELGNTETELEIRWEHSSGIDALSMVEFLIKYYVLDNKDYEKIEILKKSPLTRDYVIFTLYKYNFSILKIVLFSTKMSDFYILDVGAKLLEKELAGIETVYGKINFDSTNDIHKNIYSFLYDNVDRREWANKWLSEFHIECADNDILNGIVSHWYQKYSEINGFINKP